MYTQILGGLIFSGLGQAGLLQGGGTVIDLIDTPYIGRVGFRDHGCRNRISCGNVDSDG